MASDKFGNNPVAPLYNATGRNPRDVDMGNPGKALGSVGSSGAGGKDFGIPGKQAQATDLGASFISPLNSQNLLWGDPLERRAGYQRQSNVRRRDSSNPGATYDAEGNELDVDAMERVAKGISIINEQNSGYKGPDNSLKITGGKFDSGGGALFSATGEGASLAGSRNTTTGYNDAPLTQTSKPAKVKTEAQKSRDRETAKARRALKSDIQKSGTTEQKERIAKEGLTGRKRPTTRTPSRRPSSPSAAPSRAQPSIRIENTGANTINNGPGASDFKV